MNLLDSKRVSLSELGNLATVNKVREFGRLIGRFVWGFETIAIVLTFLLAPV